MAGNPPPSRTTGCEQAFKTIEVKGLPANPSYLGVALWGFASKMAYPPHSENNFSPSTPFVSVKEEEYLKANFAPR